MATWRNISVETAITAKYKTVLSRVCDYRPLGTTCNYNTIANLLFYSITALRPFVGPSPLFSFLIYTQSVALLGRGISPSQDLYLQKEQ
jgi:hypothetical protein